MADTIQQYVENKSGCTAEYRSLVESSIWNEVRMERDKLLAESDWTVMPDSPLSSELKTQWTTYRQALRDIPQGDVPTIDVNQNIVGGLTWPTKPGD